MNAGRRPKSVESKIEEGEKTLLPVVLSERGVTRPEDLTPLQTELWDAIVPHVEVVLQQSDQASYRGMVTALSRAIEADRLVNKDGIIITREVLNTRTGRMQKVEAENPALKVAQNSWKLFNQFADRMGLSPSARAKLGLLGAQAMTAVEQLEKKLGEDPWARGPEDVIEQEVDDAEEA